MEKQGLRTSSAAKGCELTINGAVQKGGQRPDPRKEYLSAVDGRNNVIS